jgi:hypothetical protein
MILLGFLEQDSANDRQPCLTAVSVPFNYSEHYGETVCDTLE